MDSRSPLKEKNYVRGKGRRSGLPAHLGKRRGAGPVDEVGRYEDTLRDLPAAPGETERQRERRERSNRVNACLRQLLRGGAVHHDSVYGRAPPCSTG